MKSEVLVLLSKRNLEAASRKLVMNKSSDLIDKQLDRCSYEDFRQQDAEIKKLKLLWIDKKKNEGIKGLKKKTLPTQI